MHEDRPFTTPEKVSIIKSVVEKWAQSNTIKSFVDASIAHYQVAPDDFSKAIFFYWWIRKNIRYVPEPPDWNDRIKTPLVILNNEFGDCSEHAILMGSILKYLNIPFKYVVSATDPREPNAINHIYISAIFNGTEYPLDTTTSVPPGKIPVEYMRILYA